MKIIEKPVPLAELWKSRETGFVDMMKLAVDVHGERLAADAELHADLEEALISAGAPPEHVWGINVYPEKGIGHADFIQYTAFINIRPSLGNRGMEIADNELRGRIASVVCRLLV
jgi:hypothetical protein